MEKVVREKEEGKVERPGFGNYIVSGSNMSLLKACIQQNSAALLVGETGVGKTTLIREVAKEHGQILIRVSVNGSMGVEEILGKWLVEKGTTKWQDGILTNAVRKGHWVVMDEINAALPEILFVLHALLDDDRKLVLAEKDNEVVVPHTDFRFFATMNPPEEYAGTKDMNKALMSRFTAVLWMDVLSELDEVRLLESRGASLDTATKLVTMARKLRERKRREDIFYFCSTRDLLQAVALNSHGVSLSDSVTGAVVNKMSPKEYEVVKSEMSSIVDSTKELPVKTLEEMIKIVQNRDADIAAAVEKIRSEYEDKEKTLRTQVKKEVSDKVRDDFLVKLKELASK